MRKFHEWSWRHVECGYSKPLPSCKPRDFATGARLRCDAAVLRCSAQGYPTTTTWTQWSTRTLSSTPRWGRRMTSSVTSRLLTLLTRSYRPNKSSARLSACLRYAVDCFVSARWQKCSRKRFLGFNMVMQRQNVDEVRTIYITLWQIVAKHLV